MEKDLLQRAVFEIKILRNRSELMNARLEMFDNMMLLLHSKPATQSQGMSPDIIWEIEKHLAAQELTDDKADISLDNLQKFNP